MSRISELAKAVKEHPGDSFYKFALALEMLKIDEKVKARVLFENIKNSDPEYVGVYYHLAKLYEELGETELATNTYRSGITVALKLNELKTKQELEAALLQLEFETEH